MTSEEHADNQNGKIVKAQTLSIQSSKSSVLVSRGLKELDKLVEAKQNNEIIIAGMEYVFVKGGTFEMLNLIDANFHPGLLERFMSPNQKVTIHDFYISKTEVTVEQYQTFCNATGRQMPSKPKWGWLNKHPIVNVSWFDAKAFCDWVGCRLPTEAEWEYSARDGGQIDIVAPTGDFSRLIDFYKGFDEYTDSENISCNDDDQWQPRLVANSSPNALGLYDMSGNVWEWCWDQYKNVFGRYCVLRGGVQIDEIWSFDPSHRYRKNPDTKYNCFSFRCAMTP